MKNNLLHNYHDTYFEKHHLLLKIRQTIIMFLCWIIFSIPIFITTATYIAYRTNSHHGHYFWYYAEGFHELNFLMLFLGFALGMIAVFCFAMSYIQTQRSQGLVNKWPLFDISQSQQECQLAEKFMTERFGNAYQRQNVRYYVVKSKQNLSKNQLREIVKAPKLEVDTDGF